MTKKENTFGNYIPRVTYIHTYITRLHTWQRELEKHPPSVHHQPTQPFISEKEEPAGERHIGRPVFEVKRGKETWRTDRSNQTAGN